MTAKVIGGKMPRELSEINVRIISLVSAGANKKEVIYKNETLQAKLQVDFTKNDEEQGIVYGIVYAPDEVDTQGDFATQKEIQKAAYRFMKNGNTSWCVDVNHDMNIVDAYVCESWIVKSDDALFSEVGAWAVGIKLEDERLRYKVKNGELTGLSMYGSGIIKEEKMPLAQVIKEALKSFFGENKTITKGESVDKEQVSELIKSELDGFKNEFLEKNEALAKANEELLKKVNDLEEQLSKSKQDKSPATVEKSFSGGIL